MTTSGRVETHAAQTDGRRPRLPARAGIPRGLAVLLGAAVTVVVAAGVRSVVGS